MSTEAMRAALEDALNIFCPEDGQNHPAPKWEARARAALAQWADERVARVALLSVMLAQDLAEAKRIAGEVLDKPRTAAPAAPALAQRADEPVALTELLAICSWFESIPNGSQDSQEETRFKDGQRDAATRIRSAIERTVRRK